MSIRFWRAAYELSNLVLLHPNCHRQLHSCEAGSLKKGL
ncbi:HNH endonuclease [Shigella boydii]